jgi:FkbM family methyltransferase
MKLSTARIRRLVQFVLSPSFRKNRRLSKAYDEMFRGVEGGTLLVEAPAFHGSFELDCRSHIAKRLLVERSYEPDVVAMVGSRIRRDRDVIDVGANIGLFSVLMSGMISKENRLLAIEPTPGAANLLRRNLARNGRRNVVVFEGAATDRKGEFPIHVIPGMEEYSSLGKMVLPWIANRSHETLLVPGETVDSLVEQMELTPGLIKIDAEGAESAVLTGCPRTIERHRPAILCEAWPDEFNPVGGVTALRRFIASHKYSVHEFAHCELVALPL